MNISAEAFHIHFETRSTKPSVFLMTENQIAAAKSRSGAHALTSLGADLSNMNWLREAHALVTSNDVIRDASFPKGKLADAAPNLKWIHVVGAGIEPLLPLTWLPPHIVLTNNSGVHVLKAEESAAMILLMLNGRMPALLSNQRHKVWDQIFTSTIRGKTALIVGVGDMGAAAAKAARGLGLRVLGVRRSGQPHPAVDEMFATPDLDRVLPRADFVVLAMPLTPETQQMFDRRRLGLLKKGAALFNFGRAGSLDHAALIDLLEREHLSGAMLDVFDREPLPPESPLWGAKNLLLTPHVTSDDLHSYMPKTMDLVFDNLKRLQAGNGLRNQVSVADGY